MIHCKNLSFAYKTNDPLILDNVSFSLQPEKITILLGNNGAGKTTLLNCIDGNDEIKQGTIEKESDCIFISDQPVLYEYLTGSEYLDVIIELKGLTDKALIYQLTDDLQLTDSLDKLIINYSLGMKHKLTLITSLVLGYKVYLIDEPLTVLDPESQRFMIDYFKRLRKEGHTFLISTHMMHVAYELADDLLILHNTKVHQVKNDFPTYQAFEDYVLNHLRLKIEQ